MSWYRPPHEVRDTEKLDAMIASLEAGGSLPPVVVIENGYAALTGSHRLAAWEALGMEPDVVEVTEEEYTAASMLYADEVLTVDEIDDFGEFCDALLEVTTNSELKAALKDQTSDYDAEEWQTPSRKQAKVFQNLRASYF